MVKIRIWGLPEEVDKAIEKIVEGFEVLSASETCHDRGNSKYVRVYLEANIGQSTDQITAEELKSAHEQSKKENLI